MQRFIGLITILLLAITLASAPAKADPVGRDMGCSPTVANPCSGGSLGGGSGGGSAGAAIGQALGQAIGEAIRGNPEEDARRKAEAEAARRRAEEQARKEDEEKKNRLLGNMMDVGDSSKLDFIIGVDSGSGLSLMTDDQATSTSPLSPTKVIPSADQARAHPKSEGFTKGFEDASQCFSRNSSSRCAGLTAEQQQTCLDDYHAGYSEGDKQRARLMQEAMQAGQQAGERDELANGASNPLADGPCRLDWITTYNKGYFQGKHAKTR